MLGALILLCPILIALCLHPAAHLPRGYWMIGLCVLVPFLAAAELGYLFLYLGAPRVVQLAAGFGRAMDLWSIWVDHFPLLLALSALWSAGNLIGLAINLARRGGALVRIFGAGPLLSALDFAAVALHFPSARGQPCQSARCAAKDRRGSGRPVLSSIWAGQRSAAAPAKGLRNDGAAT